MKKKISTFFIIIMGILIQTSDVHAIKKVAQSGMTYLAISLGARESAMGNASVASVKGIQGLFYNPAILTNIQNLGITVNQVNWLADTKLYGVGAAKSLAQYGTVGVDLVYMDYGIIMGTQRVDKSVSDRGFITTGDINAKDYALGLAYAYQVNDRFSFGFKIKYAHENLGNVPIAVDVIDQASQLYQYEDRNWSLNQWGFDFGGIYKTGFKDLTLGVAFQNYSGDMQYWLDAFQMPLVIRMGLSMDISEFVLPGNENFNFTMAVDGLHPIDYLEQIHVGGEIEYLKILFLRAGYQFNHDVENFSAGFGLNFSYSGYGGSLDYAYTSTEYFKDVNRFSLSFTF
jgi:hypothetical protein